MIPGKFDYHRPTTKADALRLLKDAGPDGRPLAGGHSLIPLMKLRVGTPSALIDLMRIPELKGITVTATTLEIGATTTQHELIASDALFEACPIIRETALLIADPQIRYCGTIGGNVGNGDPGNDMPALMQCLDASYVVDGAGGSRRLAARAFYRSAYITALQPGELISKIVIPLPVRGHGYAYTKLKRKVGDYATAAAAVMLEMSGGTVKAASIALTNLGDTPLMATDATGAIVGTTLAAADVERAVRAAEAIVKPTADGRGSAAYRTRMAGVMVQRALETAKGRAGDVPAAQANRGGLFGWLKK